MNPSEEIKTRLDLVDVIREYIPLKPAGVNFSARCPFHNEKSPSFMVSPDKQIFHCFGCGKGGDVFTFVMEMEGLSFVEALRQLAPKAGVELRAENQHETSQRNRLLDAMAQATRFYHQTLLEHPLAQPAREYLERRGLTEEVIEDWQIGFSLDDWEDLVKHLGGKGFKDEEIHLAGLSQKKEGSNRYYNRFRGRIMFPINDVNGNPVAFTARVSPEREATEKMGKYINSPQTAIYDKGRVLFALDKAKQSIKQAGMAIIVEGQMDAITAHQYGYRNVVASSGTALTEGQVSLLKRFTDTFALAFDADQAGQTAIERGETMVNQHAYQQVEAMDARGRLKTYLAPTMTGAISLKVIEIPNGKDPDDCIKSDPAAWEEAVKSAKPVMQYYFDKTLARLDIKQVEGKREATKILLPAIAKLGNKIEQEAWIRKLAQILGVSENLLIEALPKKPLSGGDAKPAPVAVAAVRKSKEEALSELLLALSLRFIEHFGFLLNHLEIQWLVGTENRELYKNLVIFYNQINDQWANEYPNVWGEQFSEANNNVATINTAQADEGRIFSYQGFRDWLTVYADQNGPSAAQSTAANHTPAQAATLDRLALLAEKEYYQYSSDQAKTEQIRLTRELKRQHLARELKGVETRLAEAERNGQNDQFQGLLEEFKILSEELRDVTL